MEGLCGQPFPCRVAVFTFDSHRQPWRATYRVASRAVPGRAEEHPFSQTAEAFAEVKRNGILSWATHFSQVKPGFCLYTAHGQSLLGVVEVFQ